MKNAGPQFARLNGGPLAADAKDLVASLAVRRLDAESHAARLGPNLRAFDELLAVRARQSQLLLRLSLKIVVFITN